MDGNPELALYRKLKRVFNNLLYPVQYSKDINLKLERITHLLALLGNPERSYPVIHVGGTSGKGSTATMISFILTSAGYKTGLHTSPYLQVINEGFQINNRLAATGQLIKYLEEMQPAINQVARENPFGCPSYFEVKVALALYLFAKAKVDVAVVEVGLGGSLDATNATEAQIAVLTNIGLDHTDILGDTIELIAEDKAGIIKNSQTVISGLTQPSTQKIIADRCQAKQAHLWQFWKDFDFTSQQDAASFSVLVPGREYSSLRLNLIGSFQKKNAACAVAAVHAFDPHIPDPQIQHGLLETFIPGRMEIVQEEPTLLIDGAHNIDKIKAASADVSTIFPNKKRIVVFALKQGKNHEEIIPYVVHKASKLILTTFSTDLWKPMPPKTISETAQPFAPALPILIESDPMKAIEIAFQIAKPEDLIWVTGSLYLVGNIRNHWYPIQRLLENHHNRI